MSGHSSHSAGASALADLLAQGRLVHASSLLATLAGLLALAGASVFTDHANAGAVVCASAVALFGLLETYLAIRVGFDRALFRRVGQGLSLEGVDESLATLGLIDEGKQGATFRQRRRGCMRLLAWQAGVTVAQYILFVLCAVYALV